MGDTLNAVIIASTFILSFIQFSENSENQRRESARRRLQDAKNNLPKDAVPRSGKLQDDYDDLIGQPPMEYTGVRESLFVAIGLSFILHIVIIKFPAFDIIVITFLIIFLTAIILLGVFWAVNRRATKDYVETCNQLRKTYKAYRTASGVLAQSDDAKPA